MDKLKIISLGNSLVLILKEDYDVHAYDYVRVTMNGNMNSKKRFIATVRAFGNYRHYITIPHHVCLKHKYTAGQEHMVSVGLI